MSAELDVEDIKNSFNPILLYNPNILVTNNVQLLTIHKAKGLEFETVFVVE